MRESRVAIDRPPGFGRRARRFGTQRAFLEKADDVDRRALFAPNYSYQFFEVEGEFRPERGVVLRPDRANEIKGAAPIRALSNSKLFARSHPSRARDSVRGGRLFSPLDWCDPVLAFASSPDTRARPNARAWPEAAAKASSSPESASHVVRIGSCVGTPGRVDPRARVRRGHACPVGPPLGRRFEHGRRRRKADGERRPEPRGCPTRAMDAHERDALVAALGEVMEADAAREFFNDPVDAARAAAATHHDIDAVADVPVAGARPAGRRGTGGGQDTTGAGAPASTPSLRARASRRRGDIRLVWRRPAARTTRRR